VVVASAYLVEVTGITRARALALIKRFGNDRAVLEEQAGKLPLG
jgi:hypothetical protein